MRERERERESKRSSICVFDVFFLFIAIKLESQIFEGQIQFLGSGT